MSATGRPRPSGAGPASHYLKEAGLMHGRLTIGGLASLDVLTSDEDIAPADAISAFESREGPESGKLCGPHGE